MRTFVLAVGLALGGAATALAGAAHRRLRAVERLARDAWNGVYDLKVVLSPPGPQAEPASVAGAQPEQVAAS